MNTDVITFGELLSGTFRCNHNLYMKLNECWGSYSLGKDSLGSGLEFNAVLMRTGEPVCFEPDTEIKPTQYVGKLWFTPKENNI